MWSDHNDCHSLIADSWKQHVIDCPMYILSQKLKSLKHILKVWNKEKFGDVHKKVEQVMPEIDAIQEEIDTNGYSDVLFMKEKEAQNNLQHALHF